MALPLLRPASGLSHTISRSLGLAGPVSRRAPNLVLRAGAHIKDVPLEPIRDPQKAPQPNHISNFDWNSVKYTDIKTEDHCLYWDTPTPTPDLLAWADRWFRSEEHVSRRLIPARAYHHLDRPKVAELVFMSLANVDKRTTLNWVFGKYLATATDVPGRLHKLLPYAIGCNVERETDFKAVLVDTPGLSSKNAEERAQMFARYMLNKRDPYVFLTINAEHGPRPQDIECLARLRRFAIPHQVILCNADRVLSESKGTPAPGEDRPFTAQGQQNLQALLQKIRGLVQPADLEPGHLPGKGEVISYSTNEDGAFGISHLRLAILQAARLTHVLPKEQQQGGRQDEKKRRRALAR